VGDHRVAGQRQEGEVRTAKPTAALNRVSTPRRIAIPRVVSMRLASGRKPIGSGEVSESVR
jgi:hypothetical protein